MKKAFIYAMALVLVAAASCKSSTTKNADPADSGQVHVNSPTMADSNKYPTTPVETGGQDTSSSAIDPSHVKADTVKTKP